jgi:predicted RNA methylase
MAFDQATRNSLQKFVGEARKLLSEEFTQQLQNSYGLDPVTGGIAELSTLPALSPSEQQTATLLRDTLEHYLAASHKADPHQDKKLVIAALDRIVREQAFTVLNRLAALRMAEARQFVMESVSHGYQSKGFQLYQRIAGSSLGETGQAYQHYLFSVFDELSLDLAVLFDRYSSQGRLFPRETVLLELLGLINYTELEMLWAEDETIGWIYQFWNGREEIDKMRSASRAPRNSREMAVRNQFFTPRYVVEFLTDNTLGRIWYEMTQGNTALIDSCQYLVRRPNEIFLETGEQAPEHDEHDRIEHSQVELLQQTVYIHNRPIKDPRDIKMLDPACGSMHFGLYAFDLFEQIYAEAWDIETKKGSEIFSSEESGLPRAALHDTYLSKEAFLADVPRLIIEHNIHGVDIDPRAAQIAGLSLWLRAQKSWSDNAIKPNHRPQIERSNIVCAEPMPGETLLLKEFTSQIQPRVLGQLVEEIFNKMQLAGEAGTLLKIEEEIQSAIDEAKAQKQEGGHWEQGGLFGDTRWEERKGTRYNFDGGLSNKFWSEAENLILAELERYAESATGVDVGKIRLFASDAAKGFAFIDLSRKRFDVVVMNPPFGDSGMNTKTYIDSKYMRSKTNLLACFMERGRDFLSDGGRVGAIVSRTGFFLSSLSDFRERTLLTDSRLECFADLGSKVLDAMVEVACCVYSTKKDSSSNFTPFIRLLTEQNKNEILQKELASIRNGDVGGSTFYILQRQLGILEGSPFVYWISEAIAKSLSSFDVIDPSYASIRVGLQTGADFRFLRTWWEVDPKTVVTIDEDIDEGDLGENCKRETFNGKSWCFYSKIDKASPFVAPIHLLVNWANNGEEIKAYHEMNGDSPSRYVRSESNYFQPGICYMLRSSRLIPYIVPRGIIPTAGRSQIYPVKGLENQVLSIISSNLASSVARFRGENFGQPKFQNSMVSSIPFSTLSVQSLSEVQSAINSSIKKYSSLYSSDETAIQFNGRLKDFNLLSERLDRSTLIGVNSEELIAKAYDLSTEEMKSLQLDMMESVNSPKWMKDEEDDLELPDEVDFSAYLSWAIGVVFGRFDIDFFLGNKQVELSADPFSPLPNRSPGMLKAGEKPFHDNNGVLVDDPSSHYDIVSIVEQVLTLAHFPVDEDIRKIIKNKFFPYHLKQYSKSRRQAPIYWPLQFGSGNFVIWFYYPKLNSETIFNALNEFLDPKTEELANTIGALRSVIGRNSIEEDELAKCIELQSDILGLRDVLVGYSKLWKPCLKDGVLITAAPMWRLFGVKAWQKKLKSTWEELERGEYEWSKMAYNFWPERVINKCLEDRSIAIAHGLDRELWVEVEVPAARGNGSKWVWQAKDLSQTELETFINNKIAQG